MKKKETSQERLNQIESELKVIKKCVDAKRFHDGLKGNDFEIVNAKLNFSGALDECYTLDSSINNYDTVLVYRQKLRNEKNHLKAKKNKAYIAGWWADRKTALKWDKILASISENRTIAANELINKSYKKLKCDVCGSSDITEAPHMGLNCNKCNPL